MTRSLPENNAGMNYVKYLLGLSILCLFSCKPKSMHGEYQNIRQLVKMMEQRFKDTPATLSDFYAIDAEVYTEQDTLIRLRQIKDYWKSIKNPVDLDIDIDLLTSDLDSIVVAVDWRKKFEQKTKRQDQFIYQSGNILMEYESEDVIFKRFEAAYLWVWEKQEDGYYRLVLNLIQDR